MQEVALGKPHLCLLLRTTSMSCEWLFPWGPPVQRGISHLSSAYTMGHQCWPCVSWRLACCCLSHYSFMPWSSPCPKKWQHHNPCLRLCLLLSYLSESPGMPMTSPTPRQVFPFLPPRSELPSATSAPCGQKWQARSFPTSTKEQFLSCTRVSLSCRGCLRVSGNRAHVGARSARRASSEK